MRRAKPAVVTVALIAFMGIFSPESASADGDPGGVFVAVALNTPLTESLRPTVVTGFPEETYDVTVAAYLNVGGVGLGSLGQVTVRATNTKQQLTFDVSATMRAKADALARRTGHDRGSVSFVIASPQFKTISQQSLVSLRPPVATKAPTSIGVRTSVIGDPQQFARGLVRLPTPNGWLRSSAPKATIATFTSVPVVDGCTADVQASPQVIRARSFAHIVSVFELNNPVARKGPTWRVLATPEPFPNPNAVAVGLRPIAPGRYAGARVLVSFAPGCPPTAAREPTFLSQLQHAVSHITARVRLSDPARSA